MVPAGAVAVALNVTAVPSGTSGHVAVGPIESPGASNLNFAPGRTVPNLVISKLNQAGGVVVTNGAPGPVHLLADVQGFFVTGVAGALYEALQPARVMDTRQGVGAASAIPARSSVTLRLPDSAVPDDAVAAALNVVVVAPRAAGHLSVGPQAAPEASNLNFATGRTAANLVLSRLGPNQTVTFYNGSDRPVHVLADLQGFERAGGSVPAAPAAWTSGQTVVVDVAPSTGLDVTVPGVGRISGRAGSFSAAGRMLVTPVDGSAPDATGLRVAGSGFDVKFVDTALLRPLLVSFDTVAATGAQAQRAVLHRSDGGTWEAKAADVDPAGRVSIWTSEFSINLPVDLDPVRWLRDRIDSVADALAGRTDARPCPQDGPSWARLDRGPPSCTPACCRTPTARATSGRRPRSSPTGAPTCGRTCRRAPSTPSWRTRPTRNGRCSPGRSGRPHRPSCWTAAPTSRPGSRNPRRRSSRCSGPTSTGSRSRCPR